MKVGRNWAGSKSISLKLAFDQIGCCTFVHLFNATESRRKGK